MFADAHVCMYVLACVYEYACNHEDMLMLAHMLGCLRVCLCARIFTFVACTIGGVREEGGGDEDAYVLERVWMFACMLASHYSDMWVFQARWCVQGNNEIDNPMWSCAAVIGSVMPWRVPLVLIAHPFLSTGLLASWWTTAISAAASIVVYGTEAATPSHSSAVKTWPNCRTPFTHSPTSSAS
jgi:hypothetical protein